MEMMRKFVLVFVSAIFVITCFVGFAQAEDRPAIPDEKEKTLSVGLNFPGIQIRKWVSEKIALELRGQFNKGIAVAGLRLYKKFDPIGFLGIEADHLDCYYKGINGTGFAAGVFAGKEFFLTQKRLSLICDMGPYYSVLSAKGQSVSGFDLVFNIGINWYIR